MGCRGRGAFIGRIQNVISGCFMLTLTGLCFFATFVASEDASGTRDSRHQHGHVLQCHKATLFSSAHASFGPLVLATTPRKCLAYFSPSHPRTARRPRPRSMAVLQNDAEADRR